jgi:putative glutamine transport system substrate-binding protein
LRIAALLIAALLFAACTGEEATPVVPTPSPAATSTPTPLPPGATLAARIRARGVLLVGIRYDLQPFGYVTAEGTLAGFDVDLGREFARRWLGDATAVQFRQVRSDTAVEHLQAGDVDLVIAALPHTQDREAGADFTLPYFIDGQALLVRAADAAAVAGPSSLAGIPVGVVSWGDAGDALWAAVTFTPTLQPYDRFDTAVAALGTGEVAAVADLRSRLFWGMQMQPSSVIVGQYTSLPLALAYPQNDSYFADLVNLTLQEMVADGTYAELYAQRFGPELAPSVEHWAGDEVPSLANAPVVASVPDTIAAIQARGRVSVAFVADRYPFAYTDETGAVEGYEARLVQRMVERWLGSPDAVDFTPTTVDTGKEMLRSGQTDILIGGLAHTRAAEMAIDFGLTIYETGEGLLVSQGSAVVDLASLSGQQVAAVAGSESGDALLAAARSAGVSLTVLPQPTLDAAVALLQGGQVAAVAAERTDLLRLANTTPGLSVLPLRLTQVPLALGLPPGDSAFRDLVNLTLQAMKADGQLDTIYTAWFDDAPPAFEVWPGVPYRALRLEVTAAP